ncbi:cysteine desulfurase [Algimonas ampicilliniresistens]|uniref:Cysteine desulfurase n=1 Tax=Algimonas ampicilliniresistens TaxID=1298735 RepID=A0ABQ5V9C7_9PROT|nr:cysteine desulfurase [Algimonas ampicilliniresistens]GLQ23196.1 cysteine desulfurase [Algimonas ampicilliniresistens]
MSAFDIQAVRAQFPILSREVNGYPLAYLDNAASAQKPEAVIDAMAGQMRSSFANVHRGLHTMANETTDAFEAARAKVATFLNAPSPDNIVFTRGATEALNLSAYGLAHMIQPGDEIVITQMEHHSNIVPWHFLRERYGAVLKFIPVLPDGSLDMKIFRETIGSKTKIVSAVYMSNVLGTINPIAEIARWAKAAGAVMIADGTQAAVHLDVDVQALGVDLFAMTGHKLYGPTAIGALYGTTDILDRMQPFNGGGEMIEDVYMDRITYADAPAKFEAGTPPILEAIGLGAAIDWFSQYDMADVHQHEMACYHAARDGLRELNSVRIFGETPDKGPVLAFNLEGAHAHDVAQIMDKYGVAVRAGQHCTQPLMEAMGVHSTVRASFGIYNTLEEADRFIAAVKKAAVFLG